MPRSAAISVLSLLLATLLARAERPNILLLFADDLGRYASAYADPKAPSPNDLVSTPVFDRIASEGALFTNAFVSAPSCTPSRASLYTGRHFFRNGSHSQLHHRWKKGAPDPFDEVTGMPNLLAGAGYHVGWTHKWHLRASLIGGKGNHYAKHGRTVNTYSQSVSAAEDPDAMREKILGEVRGNFRDFLAKRKKDQPFFYSFNPTNPHRKWTVGSGKKLWGLDPDQLEGKLPPFLHDSAINREDMADYLGEGMAFDAACGVILEELRKTGEYENTLICITGDHGAPGFPRGKCNVYDFGSRVLLALRWPETIAGGRRVEVPVSLIDLAPTFLAAAGIDAEKGTNGDNLLPALARGAKDDKLRGWALIGREVHVGSAREGYLPYPVRALRTPEFLYVMNLKPDRWPMGDPKAVTETEAPPFKELANNTRIAFADLDAAPAKAWLVEARHEEEMAPYVAWAWGKRPPEELYDLRKDPHQVKNLAADENYEEVREKLRKQLMDELTANKDPRIGDAFDKPPYCIPSR